MVPHSSTQISRPLPSSRPIPPTPPRGTVYVVERFGRFSRLLPGNGPPLLPLVDRVIAAYARRVDQTTPPDGLIAVLSALKRVTVHAKWSIRLVDPRKLAYRISDVDRCVDMLVHVRLRDTLSTLPPTVALDDPAVLKRLSDIVRAGVDETASRFGVSCPHFQVLSVRAAEQRAQKSLNLAKTPAPLDYYTNGLETVLPELPRDAADAPIQSFSSLPSLPPPHSIKYPQPIIAYPQPPQPPRRPPALASIRPPPPPPTISSEETELTRSDDDVVDAERKTSGTHPTVKSSREIPVSELNATPPPDPLHSIHAIDGSLGGGASGDDMSSQRAQPQPDMGGQPMREPMSSAEDPLILSQTNLLKELPVSEDEEAEPLSPPPSSAEPQELPRDASTLTDDTVPPSVVPLKRGVIYAPPPSPTTLSEPLKDSCRLSELLMNALTSDIKNSASRHLPESSQSQSEMILVPRDQVSPPAEEGRPVQNMPSSLLQGNVVPTGRVSTPQERVSPPLDNFPLSAQIERELSPRASPSPQQPLPALKALPPAMKALPPPQRGSPQSRRESPIPQRVSPPPTSPSDGFSPPMASILASVPPTPHSELPPSEQSSASASDTPREELLPSPAESPPSLRHGNASEDLRSEPEGPDDSTNREVPSPVLPTSRAGREEPTEVGRAPRTAKETQPLQRHRGNMENTAAHVQSHQVLQAPSSFPSRSGAPFHGPSMIPLPTDVVRERRTGVSAASIAPIAALTAAVSATATASAVMSQARSFPANPPRAPTPHMMPIAKTPVHAASVQLASLQQSTLANSWQPTPVVAAEGLNANHLNARRAVPLGVGTTHAAEVGNRARHAISQADQRPYSRNFHVGDGEEDQSDGSSLEAVNENIQGRTMSSQPPKRDLRKRREQVQTTSLFSSVVGKAERATKSAGTSLASNVIDTPVRMIYAQPTQPRVAGAPPHGIHKNAQTGPPRAIQPPQPGVLQNSMPRNDLDAKREVQDMHHASRVAPDGFRERQTQRRGPTRVRDASHSRRDGKRLRTTEEEETLSQKEHARREKLMGELDKIEKRNKAGGRSSDEDSTAMMVDDGSDEERARFNDESMIKGGTKTRRSRGKSRHRRRHARYEDDGYDSEDASSGEENCTECGHHRHHGEHDSSSSHRKGRSKSRSKRPEKSHDRSDYDSEPRSTSRSRSGRERKSGSEVSTGSHRSGGSSSHDRHRSKKSSSRDRKIEKTSSSSRSRSRDGKRSHSKSRSSSSKKRDGDDRKRKDSKSKSKNRDKRATPTREQLEYTCMESEVKPIYRHRLPESDSGRENPIPWYCEGQSQAEDTDIEDYHGSSSSESDGGKDSRTSSTVYSSYGRRNRHGRRHRAHHNRSVTFLYDDQY